MTSATRCEGIETAETMQDIIETAAEPAELHDVVDAALEERPGLGAAFGTIVEPEQESAGPDRRPAGNACCSSWHRGRRRRRPPTSGRPCATGCRRPRARCSAAYAPRSRGASPRGGDPRTSRRVRTSLAMRSRTRRPSSGPTRASICRSAQRSRWTSMSSPARGNSRRADARLEAEIGGAGEQGAPAPAVERHVYQGCLEQAVTLLLTTGRLAHAAPPRPPDSATKCLSSVSKRQLTQVRHAHRVEDAVEMIDLVLHHSGVQALRLALDGARHPASGRGSRSGR